MSGDTFCWGQVVQNQDMSLPYIAHLFKHNRGSCGLLKNIEGGKTILIAKSQMPTVSFLSIYDASNDCLVLEVRSVPSKKES